MNAAAADTLGAGRAGGIAIGHDIDLGRVEARRHDVVGQVRIELTALVEQVHFLHRVTNPIKMQPFGASMLSGGSRPPQRVMVGSRNKMSWG